MNLAKWLGRKGASRIQPEFSSPDPLKELAKVARCTVSLSAPTDSRDDFDSDRTILIGFKFAFGPGIIEGAGCREAPALARPQASRGVL